MGLDQGAAVELARFEETPWFVDAVRVGAVFARLDRAEEAVTIHTVLADYLDSRGERQPVQP